LPVLVKISSCPKLRTNPYFERNLIESVIDVLG
jgi:hypothetical protein